MYKMSTHKYFSIKDNTPMKNPKVRKMKYILFQMYLIGMLTKFCILVLQTGHLIGMFIQYMLT